MGDHLPISSIYEIHGLILGDDLHGGSPKNIASRSDRTRSARSPPSHHLHWHLRLAEPRNAKPEMVDLCPEDCGICGKWWGDCNQKMEHLKPTLGKKTQIEKSLSRRIFKEDLYLISGLSFLESFWGCCRRRRSRMELLKRIKNQANQITVGHLDLSFYQASTSSIKFYLDSVGVSYIQQCATYSTSSLDPRWLSFFRMGFPLKK